MSGAYEKVTVAKSAGFCFGVDKAVKLVFGLLSQGKKVCTLGPIIHNTHVVADFAARGARVVNDVGECMPGECLVIRSHGVPKSVYIEIDALGLEFYDATCPFVDRIHKIAEDISSGDNVLIICGDENHPEVVGIRSFFDGDCFVVDGLSQFERLQSEKSVMFAEKQLHLVAQTTFSTIEWLKCTDFAKKHYTNIKIFGTICCATDFRQNDAVALSQKSDMMVVVGDHHSSNTRKLVEVCSKHCKTYLIEDGTEFVQQGLMSVFLKSNAVGLTEGASTPADIIKEVLSTMTEEFNKNETEKVEVSAAAPEMSSEEISFEEALEASLQKLSSDDKVIGVVVGIAPNEVQVEVVGRKQTGYIPANELSFDPNVVPSDVVKIGDELQLLIMRTNDQEGTITLSKKRVDAAKGWNTVVAAKDSGEVLEGVVTNVINGGLLAVTHGVRVFIPASHASVNRMDDLSPLLNKTVRFVIIETSEGGRNGRRAVASIRQVAREERKALSEAFWNDVEIGKEYTGEVKSLTSYGAFVDLGGVDGMIHISQLSWSRIKHPSDVVKVGDTVTVTVRDLDREKHKISLTFLKEEENPWTIFTEKYPVGTVTEAKIVGMTDFGAFAQIMPGIDGLIHISQIADRRIEKPQDELSIGQVVTVKITNVDYDNKRISLSMRELLEKEDADEPAEATETVEADEVSETEEN